jgi:hypothetical protein
MSQSSFDSSSCLALRMVPLAILCLLSLSPGLVAAQGVGRCIDEVDTYRSLVVHRSSDAGMTVGLPDGSSFDIDANHAIEDDSFWENDLVPLAGFSIDRTLRNLVVSDPFAPDDMTEEDIETRVDLLAASWILSFEEQDSFVPKITRQNGDPVISFLLDGRSGEAGLSIDDFFELKPVALFNRIDARDEFGTTCGEHRIVYSRDLGTFNRMLLIFEAEIANPHPERGPAGCLPLAKHWAEASELEGAELAAHLEELYYEGLPGFAPAIDFAHLGAPFGQVRGNLFVSSSEWQLREWHVGSQTDPNDLGFSAPIFRIESVKNTALAELFKTSDGEGVPVETVSADEVDWSRYLDAFQTFFQQQTTPELLSPEDSDLGIEDGGVGFLSAIRAPVDEGFTEFQATSQGGGEVSPEETSAEIKDRAACWLEGAEGLDCGEIEPISGTLGVTEDHLIERTVRAGTCDGCHQVPFNTAVSPDLVWPMARSFVHVTTQGGLSQALHGTFLPPRAAGLVSMIQEAPSGDVNLDGRVDVMDLVALLSNWQMSNDEFDQDCDGVITSTDLLMVLAGWSSPSTRQATAMDNKLTPMLRNWGRMSETQKARSLVLFESVWAETGKAQDALDGVDGRPRGVH